MQFTVLSGVTKFVSSTTIGLVWALESPVLAFTLAQFQVKREVA